MSKYLEVTFRGERERHLLPWRPTIESSFECSSTEAQQRFDDLVEAGQEGREVDGVVPYVVEIRRVKRKFVPHQNADAVTIETLLWAYAESDAVQWGPWATPEVVVETASLN
jgi:hypothetical protein